MTQAFALRRAKPEPFDMRDKIILGILVCIAGCFYRIKQLVTASRKPGDDDAS